MAALIAPRHAVLDDRFRLVCPEHGAIMVPVVQLAHGSETGTFIRHHRSGTSEPCSGVTATWCDYQCRRDACVLRVYTECGLPRDTRLTRLLQQRPKRGTRVAKDQTVLEWFMVQWRRRAICVF